MHIEDQITWFKSQKETNDVNGLFSGFYESLFLRIIFDIFLFSSRPQTNYSKMIVSSIKREFFRMNHSFLIV